MRKSAFYLAITPFIFMLVLIFMPSSSYSFIKPRWQHGAYTEGSTISSLDTADYSRSASMQPYLENASWEIIEEHQVYRLYSEMPRQSGKIFVMDYQQDFIAASVLQEVEHFRNDFLQVDQYRDQDIFFKLQIFKRLESHKDNGRNVAIGYGMIFPQIHNGELFLKTFAPLVSAGYNKTLIGNSEFEIIAGLGYYPAYCRHYMENKISLRKHANGLGFEVALDSVVNDLKLLSPGAISSIDEYLRFGAIHPKLGQYAIEHIEIEGNDTWFLKSNTLNFKVYSEFPLSLLRLGVFAKFSSKLSGNRRLGNYTIELGVWQEF